MSLTKEEIDALLNGVELLGEEDYIKDNVKHTIRVTKYGNIMDSPKLVSQFVNKQMQSDNNFNILHEQMICNDSSRSLFLSYTYEGELQ